MWCMGGTTKRWHRSDTVLATVTRWYCRIGKHQSKYSRGGGRLQQQWMHFLEQNQPLDGPPEVSLILLSSFSFSAHVHQWLDVAWSYIIQVAGWWHRHGELFLLVQEVSQPCQEGSAPSCTLLVPGKGSASSQGRGSSGELLPAVTGGCWASGGSYKPDREFEPNGNDLLIIYSAIFWPVIYSFVCFFKKVEFLLLLVSDAAVTAIQRF